MKCKMKIHQRVFEDLHKVPYKGAIDKLDTIDGNLDELIFKTREFYKDVYSFVFDSLVRAVWLRGQLTYGGERITKVRSNGQVKDSAIAFFMKGMVGVSGTFLLHSGMTIPLSSYFEEFFLDFYKHNPFEEPEYYEFPYKNISIEHLIFVHECHNRTELLREAESRAMNVRDFINWATDRAFCYNIEVDKEVYKIGKRTPSRNFAYLRRVKDNG